MDKVTFETDETTLPITMEQFQTLTNEILTEVNKVCAPHFLDADYLAQILMSAIHAMDHKFGYVKKSDLFASCINRISCHVTYHAVEEIQARIKAKAGVTETTPEGETTTNVIPLEQQEEHA
jgi:hypothetical protein